MRYVAARLKTEGREVIYRIYITDALKALTEDLTRVTGGSSMSRRYAELLENKPADTRTGEDILADLVERGGLVVE